MMCNCLIRIKMLVLPKRLTRQQTKKEQVKLHCRKKENVHNHVLVLFSTWEELHASSRFHTSRLDTLVQPHLAERITNKQQTKEQQSQYLSLLCLRGEPGRNRIHELRDQTVVFIWSQQPAQAPEGKCLLNSSSVHIWNALNTLRENKQHPSLTRIAKHFLFIIHLFNPYSLDTYHMPSKASSLSRNMKTHTIWIFSLTIFLFSSEN